MNEVICSQCGHRFKMSKIKKNFNPSKCPSCKSVIKDLKVPDDGSRIIAYVK